MTELTSESQVELRGNRVLAVQERIAEPSCEVLQEGASAGMVPATRRVCFAQALEEIREFSNDEGQRMRCYNSDSKPSSEEKAQYKTVRNYSNFLKAQ